MKLVNNGHYSLSFSMPVEIVDNAGVTKNTFKLVIINKDEAVRVDPKSWEQISGRRSIKKLIQHGHLLEAKSAEDMAFDVPEATSPEAREEQKKKRKEELNELSGMNWKRAVSRVGSMNDVSFLRDLDKIDHRKSMKTAIKERLEQLEKKED